MNLEQKLKDWKQRLKSFSLNVLTLLSPVPRHMDPTQETMTPTKTVLGPSTTVSCVTKDGLSQSGYVVEKPRLFKRGQLLYVCQCSRASGYGYTKELAYLRWKNNKEKWNVD